MLLKTKYSSHNLFCTSVALGGIFIKPGVSFTSFTLCKLPFPQSLKKGKDSMLLDDVFWGEIGQWKGMPQGGEVKAK